MDFRVLFASFALVFLAELGDKTQLTALAFTTSSRSPWMVFFGTSMALVTASAMAVLFGEALNRIAIVQKYLPIVSGAMFILMGLVLLINVARKAEVTTDDAGAPPEAVETGPLALPARGGALFSLIIQQAATLEEDVLTSLQEIHHALSPGKEKDVLAEIIDEDRRHLGALKGMPEQHAGSFESSDTEISAAEFAELHNGTFLFEAQTNACRSEAVETAELIGRAVTMEESLANAYLAFARMSKVHDVRDAFRWLAMEDIRHAQTLCDLVNPSESGTGDLRAEIGEGGELRT